MGTSMTTKMSFAVQLMIPNTLTLTHQNSAAKLFATLRGNLLMRFLVILEQMFGPMRRRILQNMMYLVILTFAFLVIMEMPCLNVVVLIRIDIRLFLLSRLVAIWVMEFLSRNILVIVSLLVNLWLNKKNRKNVCLNVKKRIRNVCDSPK